MKFLALEREISDEKITEEALKAEAQKVLELYQAEIITEIYFDENHSAVIILETENKEEAEKILSEFPLCKNRYISFDIKELNPYTGFSRLAK